MDPNTQTPQPTNQPLSPQQQAAQEAADRQARIDYLKSLHPQKQGKPAWVKVLVVILVLLVVIGGAGAAFLLANATKDEPTLKVTPKKQAAPVVESDEAVEATEPFNSNLYGLTINHPKKWTATEEGGNVAITSPATKLTDATGQAFTGQIVIGIGPKGQGLTAFDAGNATAVRDSEKLTYKQPTAVQRAQTYLTFAQYKVTTTKGALDAMYITGNYGYLKGQAVPKVDMVNLDPLLSITFLKCTDATCTTAALHHVTADSWARPAFAVPIKTAIESLAIN